MVISYDKLWKMLIDKKMTKNALRLQAEMSSSTMAKMSKNETVSMDVLLRICKVLDCEFDDIIEIKKVEDRWTDILGNKDELY